MNPRISAGPSRRPPGGCPAAQAAGIPASQKAGGSKGRPGVPARPRRALPRPPPNRASEYRAARNSAAYWRHDIRRHHTRRHHSRRRNARHRSGGTVPPGLCPACRHAADRQPLHTAAGIPAAAGSARRSSARPAPHDIRRNSAGQRAARRLPGGSKPPPLPTPNGAVKAARYQAGLNLP